MTPEEIDIRRLEDGSIDFAFYDRRARAIRSDEAYKAVALVATAVRTAWTSLTKMASRKTHCASDAGVDKVPQAALAST
ncbi:hypothetical protein [Roseibium sp. MMSF_3544]|uniref:hypothetical protein n=1 Tax=unclassified Roseibium TaxID=2629323 RepID=UPI00273F0BF9|nr:hypothetical protein [Roseibium sp. MMSF_3544]